MVANPKLGLEGLNSNQIHAPFDKAYSKIVFCAM